MKDKFETEENEIVELLNNKYSQKGLKFQKNVSTDSKIRHSSTYVFLQQGRNGRETSLLSVYCSCCRIFWPIVMNNTLIDPQTFISKYLSDIANTHFDLSNS